ncbi:MAG: ethanolamine utilization protein EutJ [Anaerolineales bacterium]|nr:ethanolamine utilization protein EutJ [Anaerolineales bacterium]
MDGRQLPALETPPQGELHVGVDLGTAYLVLVVLDEHFQPIVGEYQFAQVVRDGLVVDFIGAVDRLREMKARVERRLGRELTHAASGFPPGVPVAERRATANVVEGAGMRCTALVDEPSAANALLHMQNGAIVDVGGGTTGISILQDGEVVYTADEATGGTHFSLVIAGAQNIPFEDAEALKVDPSQQVRLFPTIRPVMEKVASIVSRHIGIYQAESGKNIGQVILVGGTTQFPRIADVVGQYTGIPTSVPQRPLFVTPLGFAMHDVATEEIF